MRVLPRALRFYRRPTLPAAAAAAASRTYSTTRFGQPTHETHPHLLKAGESLLSSARPARPCMLTEAQSRQASRPSNTPYVAQSLLLPYPQAVSP